MFFKVNMFRHFLRLVIPPQTNNSSNISVFNRWVPMGACPKCSQIADISRSLADHDAKADILVLSESLSAPRGPQWCK